MTEFAAKKSLIDHFSALDDPREAGKVEYPLTEFMLGVLCATLAGAESVAETLLQPIVAISPLSEKIAAPTGLESSYVLCDAAFSTWDDSRVFVEKSGGSSIVGLHSKLRKSPIVPWFLSFRGLGHHLRRSKNTACSPNRFHSHQGTLTPMRVPVRLRATLRSISTSIARASSTKSRNVQKWMLGVSNQL